MKKERKLGQHETVTTNFFRKLIRILLLLPKNIQIIIINDYQL